MNKLKMYNTKTGEIKYIPFCNTKAMWSAGGYRQTKAAVMDRSIHEGLIPLGLRQRSHPIVKAAIERLSDHATNT